MGPEGSALQLALQDVVKTARIPASLAPLNDPGHGLTAVNDRFCELTGYDAEEIVGRNCKFLQGELTTQRGAHAVRAFLHDPEAENLRTQIINFRKDGSAFVNVLMLSKLSDRFGKHRFVLGSQFEVASVANPDEAAEAAKRMEKEPDTVASEHHMIIHGSLQALANGAAQIARAKIRLASS